MKKLKKIIKKNNIKIKIIKLLTKNGKKFTSEKILLKSIKEIQNNSNKKSKSLVKFALNSSMPFFKINRFELKKRKKKKIKESPGFILLKMKRIALAIKFILSSSKNKKSDNFYNKLKNEIIMQVKQSANTTTTIKKTEINNKILNFEPYLTKYFKLN